LETGAVSKRRENERPGWEWSRGDSDERRGRKTLGRVARSNETFIGITEFTRARRKRPGKVDYERDSVQIPCPKEALHSSPDE